MINHGMLPTHAHTAGGIGFWLTLAIAAAMAYGIYSSLHDALNLPIVQRSTSTGECVAVLTEGPESCGTLPSRYSVEWVE